MSEAKKAEKQPEYWLQESSVELSHREAAQNYLRTEFVEHACGQFDHFKTISVVGR